MEGRRGWKDALSRGKLSGGEPREESEAVVVERVKMAQRIDLSG